MKDQEYLRNNTRIAAMKEESLSRREFLKVSGQVGLGALALAVDGRALLLGQEGTTQWLHHSFQSQSGAAWIREIYLEAREVDWELAPGKIIKAMAYNGQIPGPEIRLKEGERVRIVLKNTLPEPTTIHWHGVDVPNPMDGVPGITQDPIRPGETFVYEFEARPAGTRWYHTHFQEHRQLDLGLYAPLIIEPAEEKELAFDREYTLVLDDWATGIGHPLLSTRAGTAGRRGNMGGMMGSDVWTINGKQYPKTEPLRLRKGDLVRVRFFNHSMEAHPMHLHGQSFKVLAVNGQGLPAPIVKDSVDVEAHMGSVDIEFIAHNPGDRFFHCHKPMHMRGGMVTLAKIG